MIPPSEKVVVRGIVPPEREGVNLNFPCVYGVAYLSDVRLE